MKKRTEELDMPSGELNSQVKDPRSQRKSEQGETRRKKKLSEERKPTQQSQKDIVTLCLWAWWGAPGQASTALWRQIKRAEGRTLDLVKQSLGKSQTQDKAMGLEGRARKWKGGVAK